MHMMEIAHAGDADRPCIGEKRLLMHARRGCMSWRCGLTHACMQLAWTGRTSLEGLAHTAGVVCTGQLRISL